MTRPLDRQALIDSLLRAEGIEVPDDDRIPARGLEESPLSFSQERLWLIEQVTGPSALYNLPVGLRLRGPLDLGALQQAIDAIPARHGILRATFDGGDGAAVQRIGTASTVQIGVSSIDGGLPRHEREREALRLATAEARRPFDLGRGPVMRARLVAVDSDDHILVVTFHHIVCDGWSIARFLDELAAAYAAAHSGRATGWAPLPVQFTDVAAWQRGRAEDPVVADYWRHTLRGAPEPVSLASRGRPDAALLVSAVESRTLSPELTGSIRRFSREHDTTPFVVMLSGFAVWMARHTAQHDLLFATPAAGRGRPETDEAIGFFVNSLPVRIRVDDAEPLAALVDRVRATALDLDACQDVPPHVLLEAWPRRTGAGRGPIAPVAFAFEPVPSVPAFAGLSATLLPLDTGLAKTDFTLTISDRGDAFVATIEYAAALFDLAAVSAMVREFVGILEQAVALAAAPVAEICERAGMAAGGLTPDALVSDVAWEQSNLTSAQAAMWLGHKMHPGVPLCNVPLVLRCHGRVDLEAFGRAFQRLVDSTDTLRMFIRERDGIPVQEIRPACEAKVEFVDLSGKDEAAANEWVQARMGRPFDLEAVLFDTAILCLGGEDFVWFFQQHHLITDALSWQLLFARMSAFYQQETGRSAEIPSRFPSFLDRAREIREFEESPAADENRRYFAAQLTEDLQPFALDGAPVEKRTTRVERLSCQLGPRRTLSVRQRAAEASHHTLRASRDNASAFQLMAGVLLAWLYRITGRSRLSIGMPFHNRRTVLDKQTTGLFMDVVPLIVDVESDRTFRQVFERVRIALSGVMRHARGGIPPDVRSTACDVVLNYMFATAPDPLGGIPVDITWLHPGHERESLAIQVSDFGESGDFRLDFDFHADVFPEALRPRIVEQFLRMLDGCLADPDRAVGDVALLWEAERRRVVHEWNRTEMPGTTDLLVPDLLEAQAARTPGAIAIESGTEAITYQQLVHRSEAVAASLVARGAGSNTLVGICLDRSIAQMVALVGIMRAGAAYLPIDPALPAARQAEIVRDAAPRWLIASPLSGASLEQLGVDVLDMADLMREEATSRQERVLHPDDLAYVIYTSGSTGKPKGVEIPHAALANHARATSRLFDLSPADRVLQFASLSFDASGEEIFPAFATGATLVLRDDSVLDSPRAFSDFCARHRVTVADLPTAYWHNLFATDEIENPIAPSVRLVVLGGEAARPEVVARWHRTVAPSVRLLNTYGPTEATISATAGDLGAGEAGAGTHVSIGRPLWNVEALVLDVARQPVEPGFAGELYLGGLGLARGYRGDPGLTSQRFVAHPWRPGDRLYRTGDRVRFREDGTLEYLGRMDRQLKVRGYRVEPGEIEDVLRSHAGVRDAIVVGGEHRGSVRLVAYVETEDGLPVAELRAFLEARLPAYMVPSVLVRLPRLPRAVSGKVDRTALPEPGPGGEDAYAAPRSDVERDLAALWCDVLGLGRIGIDDSFFAAGGHSLLAAQVLARIRTRFRADVPLRLLFESPTIRSLAAAIERGQAAAERPDDPILRVDRAAFGAKRAAGGLS